MEVSSSKIKKCLIFPEMELSYISGRNLRDRKIKKTRSEKISYIFSKKAFLIFRETELFYVFLKKVFLIFYVMELSSPKIKKFQEVTFRARKIKNPALKKFLIFREMELSSSKKLNKTFSYS